VWVVSISSEAVVINALNHEIRRDILKVAREKPVSFSALLDLFSIAPGKLDYHLKLLVGLLEKNERGLYKTTALGDRVVGLLEGFQQTITTKDRPLIKQAFTSQLKEKRSFLRVRLVGGLYFKVIALIAALVTILVTSIQYLNAGMDIMMIWPLYLLVSVIGVAGLIWVFQQYGPAKEFSRKVEELLKDSS
jgi:hypothetical protein